MRIRRPLLRAICVAIDFSFRHRIATGRASQKTRSKSPTLEHSYTSRCYDVQASNLMSIYSSRCRYMDSGTFFFNQSLGSTERRSKLRGEFMKFYSNC